MIQRALKRLSTLTILTASSLSISAQQIIENSGFQEITNTSEFSNWTGDNSTISLEWQGHESDRSAYVYNRSSSYNGIRQDVIGKISLGQTMDLSAWVKLKNGSSSATSEIYVVQKDDDGWSWNTVASGNSNGWTWQELTGTWTADWSGTLEYLFVCVAGPTPSIEMLVDDVSATVSGESTTDEELILNGDIEDSTENIDPWETDNASASIEWQSQGSDGSRSAYVHYDDSEYAFGLQQDIKGKISQGQTLDLSAWVKLKSGSASSTSTMYVLQNDDNGWTWNTIASENTNGWSWQQLEGSWTAEWTGTLLDLYVYLAGPDDNSGMLLDNVSAIIAGGDYCSGDEVFTYSTTGEYAHWVSGGSNFVTPDGRSIDYTDTDLGYSYSIDRWITNAVWTGDISIDFTDENNSQYLDQAIPSTFSGGLPLSVWWENEQLSSDWAHQEFNIRVARNYNVAANRSDSSEHWGYGTKPISELSSIDMSFEGYWDCGSEGPRFVNMTIWVQDTVGDMYSNDSERIDIIIHEWDSGLVDWRKMVSPSNEDYIAEGSSKRWAVISPEPAEDGLDAVNTGRPALNMAGSDYLVIRRSPGDEGEKCSYNIIRKTNRVADSEGYLGGSIDARVVLDYLIAYDAQFNTSWNIYAAEWTVTGQGRYNLKYNETRFGGTGEDVRTIPSKGKWTFTTANLPDLETY
jgi:hypothetical protein